MSARLKPDAVPTIDNANEVQRVEEPLSSRQRRKVQNLIYISCGFEITIIEITKKYVS